MAPQAIPNVIAYRSNEPNYNGIPPCDTEGLHRAAKIVHEYLVGLGCVRDSSTKLIVPKKKLKAKLGTISLEQEHV